MSCEDEFELNYVKIDSKNEIQLLDTDDYAVEIGTLFSTVEGFDQYTFDKKVSKDIEKFIPDNSELLKNNIEFAKNFIKIINSDKRKNFNTSVKRILSIDFRKEFIFNYTNIFDVCSIITLLFSECKKYKITSIDDLKNLIKKINLQRYDFYRLYLDYGQTKKRNSITKSLINKIKTNDNMFQLNDISPKPKISFDQKVLNKNIKSNYVLNNENNYSNEEENIKIVSKRTFIYPDYNKIGNKDPNLNKTELPIELILLLSKFKEVSCLVFQIQNLGADYINLATFILSNIDWLFLKGIDEIKFDLCNEEIQQGLDKAFDLITKDLYKKKNISKKEFYYNGIYHVRSINCWIPENDIFFEEKKMRKNDYIYKTQITEDSVIIDNYICNIYNAFGNLMNIKYISQINFSLMNNYKHQNISQLPDSRTSSRCLEEFNRSNTTNFTYDNNSIECFNESISIFDLDNQEKYTTPKKSIKTISQVNNDNNIPSALINFREDYFDHFNMILIYCCFLNKYLKNINKLSLFFQNSFCYEIDICHKTDPNLGLNHFLIFLNKIETLKEVNFSFNSLDDKSFEYILGIIYKNNSLSTLRMSFFTPDINYYDNALFDLCSSKKMDLIQLFSEFSEYQKKHWKNKGKNINEYILNEKLLDSFVANLCNLSNLLKLQLLQYLEELIFRFDIPLPLINNQKYKIVIIKFIINLLIMITFQQNKTKTFKILAPNLELNCNKMPFISMFFNEISLSDEIHTENNEKNNNLKIESKKIEEGKEKENEINEQEKNLVQKNEKNEIINKKKENDQPEIYSQLSQEKNNNECDTDSSTNFENLENSNSYNKSTLQKNINEKAVIRKDNVEQNTETTFTSRKLNPNDRLEKLVLQMNISFLPEIFNFCKINNLSGLKYINLGNLDEITFKGFVNDYKLNCNKLKSLISLKINLGFSVLSYDNLEKYIFDFININSPKLEEKLLLSNLKINNEVKMKELIELVYLKANIEKLVVKINFSNINLLSSLLPEFFIEYKNKYSKDINTLSLVLNHPKYKNIFGKDILSNLFDFIGFSKNRTILCNEYS